jgi:hypothetical protein
LGACSEVLQRGRVLLGEMGRMRGLLTMAGDGRQHASSAQSALALGPSGAGADRYRD